MSKITFEIRSPARLDALTRVVFALACIKRVDLAKPEPGDMPWVSDEDEAFWDSMPKAVGSNRRTTRSLSASRRRDGVCRVAS